MEIIIKRKVSLGFLGDDYKEAYLSFKSIPISGLEEFDKRVEEVNKLEGVGLINGYVEILKERFVEGKFPDAKGELQNVVADDLTKFDIETYLTVLEIMKGGVLADPKG